MGEVSPGDISVEVFEQRQAGTERRGGDPLLLGERVQLDLAKEQPGVL